MEKFFKTGKAAKLLNVTTRTLKRWAKKGILVPVKTAENGYHFYSEFQIAEFKTRDIDVMPLAQNSAGDTCKPRTFAKTYDKTYDIGKETASAQALRAEGNCDTPEKMGVIPPESVQNRDKTYDIDEKTASVQALRAEGNCDTSEKMDVIAPESVQNRVTKCDIGVVAPLSDNRNCDISKNCDTSTKVVSVNILPTTKMVVPNDKFCRTFFSLSQKEYDIILANGGTIEECEKSKVGKIYSEFEVVLLDNYSCTIPLNMFDKAVLIACDSEFIAGNKFTTPAIIYRNICGKSNGSKTEPPPEVLEAILASVRKMMCTQITYDMSLACKHLKYNNGESFKVTAPVLPCQYTTGIAVCGKETENVIEFFRESPVMAIARAKNNQLLTFDKKLLDIPNKYNTLQNISIKHYILHRILEIKLHHNLRRSITFEDVFTKCNLLNADRRKKSRVRKEIVDIMTFLRSVNDISSFVVKKVGNKYHSIEFSFPKSDSPESPQKTSKVSKTKGGYKKSHSRTNGVTTRPSSSKSPPTVKLGQPYREIGTTLP